MNKLGCFTLFFLATFYLGAQISDDFSDGDFTNNPTWASSDVSGNGMDFTISSGELRSAGPSASATLHLSTQGIPDLSSNDLSWTVKARYGSGSSAPSGSNNSRIYLVADNSDLSNVTSGYYIQMGESGSGDGIDLYEVGNGTPIIEDLGNLVAAGINVNLLVTRTSTGDWIVSADASGGSSFTQIGTFSEMSVPSFGTYFGFMVNHTSSNYDNFYFDDVAVTATPVADTQSPTLVSYEIQNSTELLFSFSEEVDETTAEQAANYLFSPLISIDTLEKQAVDTHEVLVTLATGLVNGTMYEVTLSGIEDLVANPLADTTISFFYVEFADAGFRDIVINELHPAPGSNGLPNEEYVELFNVSTDSYYQLENWSLEDASGNTATLPVDTLGPEEYVMIAGDTSLFYQYVKRIQVTVPSLNNSGDVLYLKDPLNQVIDSVVYSTSSSNSIEQINPTIGFFLEENYAYSTNSKGGTPGLVNSIFDDTPDSTPPSIVSTELVGNDSLILTFDERLDQAAAESLANYTLTSQSTTPDLAILEGDEKRVILHFSTEFTSGLDDEVQVEGVTDLFGNSVTTTTSFIYYLIETAIEGEVLINEFLVSPNEDEFIELLNISDKYLDLHGWVIEDASGNQLMLTTYRLDPDSLVAVTSTFGTDSLGVSGFPLLNNSSDKIFLKNEDGLVVDSVAYDMFVDGTSYELINPTLPCRGFYNYGFSESGHTSGLTNSLYTDVDDADPPRLLSLEVLRSDSIWVEFDEPLDLTFDLSGAFSFSSVSIDLVQPDGMLSYWVILDPALTSEVYEAITLSDVTDCSGNVLADTVFNIYIDEKPPELEQVVLWSDQELLLCFDELLENITSLDKSKFLVEGFSVTDLDEVDSLESTLRLTLDPSFEIDTDYSVSIEGLEDTTGNATEGQNKLFTFSSAVTSVSIPAANILDVHFDSQLDSASVSAPGHFWINELGHPISAIWDSSEPNQVRLQFGESVPDNKSLLLYMLNIYDEDSARLSSPAFSFVYDTDPPELIELDVPTDSTLLLAFDEAVDPGSAINPTHFSIDDEQVYEVVMTASDQLMLIPSIKLVEEVLEELTYDKLRDLHGNQMSKAKSIMVVYDKQAPTIDSVYQSDRNQLIILASEEIQEGSIAIDQFWYNQGTDVFPLDYVLRDNELTFDFADSIPQIPNLDVFLTGWSDMHANEKMDTLHAVISTLQPRLTVLQPSSDTMLRLWFNQRLSSTSLTASNYLIGEKGASAVNMTNGYVEVIFSDAFFEGDTMQLALLNIENSAGEPLVDTLKTFVFDSYVAISQALDSMKIVVEFDLPIISDQILDFSIDGEVPDLQTINLDDPGEVILVPSASLDANISYLLEWSTMESASGFLIPAFYDSVLLDKEAPVLLSIESDYFGKLVATFSEPLSEPSLVQIKNYQIPGIGLPSDAEILSNEVVELQFPDLVIGLPYQLVYYNATDLSGNLTSEGTFSFDYVPPILPKPGEIVINEFMPDPTPSVGLPEREYIELWNVSDQAFSLNGLQLSDKIKTVSLPDYLLEAGDWVALAAGSENGLFLETSSLPSLDNSSDSLALSTVLGDVLDVVVYQSDWHEDSEKRSGGYSLELINPGGVCPNYVRWNSSNVPEGGTPGAVNSIYNTGPDGVSPLIVAFDILSQDSILVAFSEAMDTTSYGSVQLSIPIAISEMVFQTSTELWAVSDDPILSGQLFDVSFSGFMDCSGTFMADTLITGGLPDIPKMGEIIITEVMPDPSPAVALPESEYVEILNKTDRLMDMSLLALNGNQLSGALMPSSNKALFPPNGLSDSLEINVLSVDHWSALINTGDTVTLTYEGQVIDQIIYDRTWYRDDEKSDGGYSLELINPDASCKGAANWRASDASAGGTPGVENSVFSTAPDQDAPYLVDFDIVSSSVLHLRFSEWMDTTRLDTLLLSLPSGFSHIEFDGLQNCTIQIVEPLIAGKLEPFEIGGFYDCSGNMMIDTTVVSGNPIAPSVGDLVITELMPDPVPVVGLPESEYIELFNLTDSVILLESVTINDVYLSGMIQPKSYLVLAPDNETSQSLAENIISVSPWVSLSNSGEELIVKIEDTELMYLNYQKTWHEVEKQDGGYSLEAVDPRLYCDQESNWRSSQSINGGTPGYQNSVYAEIGDKSPPSITYSEILDSAILRVSFDEYPLFDEMNWSIDPLLAIEDASYDSLDRLSVLIKTLDPLSFNQHYSLTLTEGADCYGNRSTELSVQLLRPERSIDELFINEILFDPKTGGEDMVELVNASESRYIDLQYLEWYSGSTIRSVSDSSLVLPPASFIALTENRPQLLFDYPQSTGHLVFELDQVPGLSNEKGYLVIRDLEGNMLDSIYYEDEFHSPFLGDTEGVTLERLSLDYPATDQDNWASASSTAGFATPGHKNSQRASQSQVDDRVKVSPRTFIPGSANPSQPSFTTINYEMPAGGMLANVHIYDVNGRVVKTVGEGMILGLDGFLTWDGSTDQGGMVRIGQYILVMELYGNNAEREYIRKPITIGAEF